MHKYIEPTKMQKETNEDDTFDRLRRQDSKTVMAECKILFPLYPWDDPEVIEYVNSCGWESYQEIFNDVTRRTLLL